MNKKSASDITSKNFYYLPLIFVTSGLFNLFGTMTNEIMTPLHVGIGDTIAALLFIFMREEDIHLVTLILQLLLIVIIIISCLICTEVIICHCLKKDTTNEIIQRGNKKQDSLQEIIIEKILEDE